MGGNAHSMREGKLSHAVLKITEDNVVAAVTAQERGSGQRSPDGKLQQIKSILQGGRGEAPRRSPVSPTAGAPATFPSGAFESPSAAEPIRLLSTVGGGAKSAPRALLDNGVTWAEIDEAIGGASSAVSGPQPSSGAVRSVSREDYVLVYPAQREGFRPSPPGPVLGTPEVDTRLRHVIEREALVTQAEAELDKRVQDALQAQRRQEQTASVKWDILRSQDRELLSRRLELEATKNTMQPATSRVSSEYSSPPPQFAPSSRSVHSSTKSPSPRPLSNPSSVAAPSQIHQGSSSSAFSLKPRDEDITSMLRRVKEREMMLRSITEKMPSAKVLR